MFPLIPIAVCGTAALVALATAVYASDQQEKRKRDQARHREEIAGLKERLARKERELRRLLRRLGKKNRQVRELARVIKRLREELAGLRLDRLREELASRSWGNSP